MRNEAVIFDMDGVLIDSEPLHISAAIALLKKFHVDTSEGYHNKYVGCSDPVKWQKIKDEFDIKSSLREILDMSVSTKLELLRQTDCNPIEGIAELLKSLYVRNIPVAVASSSPSRFIEEVIDKIKIEKYIRTWVSGENIEKSKPEPDIFLKTAELLQVNPRGCVVIEDSKNGVIAAKKAGMRCIGFKNMNSGSQDLSKADLVVDKIQDIDLCRLLSMEY